MSRNGLRVPDPRASSDPVLGVYPRAVRSRRADALVIFGLALVARLTVVVWAHQRFPAVEDGHYYDVLARRIAMGAGYTWLWPDGTVTSVAHYPVGYPALVATGYLLFGASAWVPMTVNALLGAASAYAAHRIVDGPGVERWRPAAAGAAVALHPALVPYTVAFMTEGVTASLLVVSAALVIAARRAQRAWALVLATGLLAGRRFPGAPAVPRAGSAVRRAGGGGSDAAALAAPHRRDGERPRPGMRTPVDGS